MLAPRCPQRLTATSASAFVGTPLSIALPDDWSTQSVTRASAKKLLKKNPDLAAQTTVDDLLSIPLSAGVDLDDDGYLDRFMSVTRQKLTGMPSPVEVKAAIKEQGVVGEVTVKRTTVAKKPAIFAAYMYDLARDDGVSERTFVTAYVFVPRGQDSFVSTFSPADEFDDEFAGMVNTMIKSVKIEK